MGESYQNIAVMSRLFPYFAHCLGFQMTAGEWLTLGAGGVIVGAR